MRNNNNITRLVGDRIREIRVYKKLSQEHAAFNADISFTFWGQIERGDKNPTVETLSKIANSLDVDITDLFNFKDPVTVEHQSKNINAINALLTPMSDAETKEVLSMIKSMINFKKIKA